MEEQKPPSTIGVAFRLLSCHGYITRARYQATVASYALAIPRRLGALFQLHRHPTPKVQILRDLKGIVRPGEMLLVLGRPGSGCSTFLKTIAGDTRGFHIDESANINYQGISYDEMQLRLKGDCVYLSELDIHFPELSLGQTLDFALSTRETPRNGTATSGTQVASLFGLGEVVETQVGNHTIRGLSGGEKRRTSIAEAFVGGARIQCWDNSTRGLDSYTAQSFIRLLRESTNSRKWAVMMSVYQASDGIYNCFDKVMLLYEGRQIYFGPVDSAASYFTRLGFIRPTRATTADFLTSLTSPPERVVAVGYEGRAPNSPDEFERAWKQSKEALALDAEIEEYGQAYRTVHKRPSKDDRTHRQVSTYGDIFDANFHLASSTSLADDQCSHSLPTSPQTYPLRLSAQVNICLTRALQRLRNTPAPSISAVVANSVLGLIIGSVFYNLGETTDDLQSRTILLFFALMVNAFAPAFEVSLMWAQRPIVDKHNQYAFYHPFTERLSSILCDLPTKVLISFGTHIPLYFLSNLRRTPGAFFVYWLFMLANLLTMSMLFRMIGSVSRTREQTLVPVSVSVLLCVIYTGFVVPPPYMVPWLGWFRYINPVAYTYESLLINELADRQFACATLVPDGPSYSEVSVSDRICAVVGSDLGQQSVQGTSYMALKYGYMKSHLWRNLGISLGMMAGFCVLHLLAAEFVPSRPARGEVLVFYRSHRNAPSENHIQQDEESGLSGARTTSLSEGMAPDSRADTSVCLSSEGVQTVVPSEGARPTAATVCWADLNYEVKTQDGTRQILKHVNGWIKPGTLTALMGVTGAGKTTLLNVLAEQITTGIVTGEVYVDGRARDATFRKRIGYVQQEDLHLPTATVREALQFSAVLRQPQPHSRAERLAYVDKVLGLMDMDRYADAVVGIPGEGLNVEQRKRLTIAVEIVARPELLLFLDEPTSGLDSQTAWSICSLLRKLADNGQAILCTIHQPSAQLFGAFDRLLLLNKGGTTLYFGPLGHDSATLINYFESHGAPKCNLGDNPAEWMMKVTGNERDVLRVRGDTQDSKRQEWSKKWEQSQEKQQVLQELSQLEASNIDEHAVHSSGTKEIKTTATTTTQGDRYSTTIPEQLFTVSKRILQEQWRDPIYLYSKIALSTGLALANGISFYHVSLDIQGLTSLLFSIFLLTQLFSTIDQLIIPRLVAGRELFEARERGTGAYGWAVFLASHMAIELFWQTLISVPLFASWYFPTGLQDVDTAELGRAERGGLAFVLVWLFNLWAATLSQAFAAGLPHPETAVQLATLCFWLSLVFCGILVSPSDLPRFWIFMYNLSPLTYFLEGLAIAGVAGAKVLCSGVETLHIDIPSGDPSAVRTCGSYLGSFAESSGGYIVNLDATEDCQFCPVSEAVAVLSSLGMDPRAAIAWRNVGIMALYVGFNMAATFGIYWLGRSSKKTNKKEKKSGQ